MGSSIAPGSTSSLYREIEVRVEIARMRGERVLYLQFYRWIEAVQVGTMLEL
jgi:hypothetical protein